MGTSDRSSAPSSKRGFGPDMLGKLALNQKLPMYISDRALPDEASTITEIEVTQRMHCS